MSEREAALDPEFQAIWQAYCAEKEARADADERLAAVEALGLDGSPGSLMETIRRSLATEAGIWPDRVNLANSLVMRDIRAALRTAIHPDPSETP